MTPEALKALIEDLRLNHEFCPKEVILQAADELERLAQPEQESVADNFFRMIADRNPKPLYTTPPQRTWVGLTEGERIDIIDEEITTQDITHFALAQAIEAKLKAKNT